VSYGSCQITVGYYRRDLAQVPLDKTLYDVITDLRPTWDRRLFGAPGLRILGERSVAAPRRQQ
jgi:hypothetical protein